MEYTITLKKIRLPEFQKRRADFIASYKSSFIVVNKLVFWAVKNGTIGAFTDIHQCFICFFSQQPNNFEEKFQEKIIFWFVDFINNKNFYWTHQVGLEEERDVEREIGKEIVIVWGEIEMVSKVKKKMMTAIRHTHNRSEREIK